ncbi:class I SAM-dependent methyltransferase [Pelagicoccus sp. SDUM812002]|uniref:class I SAM-dependent methyltransferase n=1 Tax=Pelagicoccus sp. SDUM812002 TaxID=3041266 RepID=UPI00280EAA9B|nr:class I SAM-dependent methyltransferase [Pelagicoccus sp. SDUM812002]MDQ8184617.1 class I SAM-dependent methyltransferase [Pelagicoccus sp. SDUM812002]
MHKQKAQNSAHATTIDQFTRQAVPFTRMPAHSDAIDRLVEIAKVHPLDHVLDIACGPGLVSNAFAKKAAHVTGIDLTQAMVDLANRNASSNTTFEIGDAAKLRFKEAQFDMVVTRYSIHHFEFPDECLAAMARVCKPGGKIVLADMQPPARAKQAFNELERLRDPSPQSAFTDTEMQKFIETAGFELQAIETYDVTVDLDEQLKSSFPNQKDGERFRSLVIEDIGRDSYAIRSRCAGERYHYDYPIAIYLAKRKA